MNKKSKTPTAQSVITDKQLQTSFSLNDLNNKWLFVFTGLLAIIYFIFSTFSSGFYMHDEPSFYMYAKDFLKDPITSFKGFQRIGYVLFLVLPSLGGFTFLNLFNSVLAAVTVLYSYKIIRKLGGEIPILVFFVLGFQPLWFMLSFRNYSEFFIAFLLVMTIWNHLNKRYVFAALLLSYAAVSRIEYHSLLGFYFIILLFKKQWVAAILTGTFTVLHNFLGFLLTDDLIYLYTRITDYSREMSGGWPKRGFDHYFTMSNVIFGGVALTLFVGYLSVKIIKKERPYWLITGATLFIILFNCLLNWQSVEIGPGNAGNLRYFIPIAPFISILGVLGIDSVIKLQKKYLLLIFLLPLLIFVGVYQTYDHNFISLMDGMSSGEFNKDQVVRLWSPFIFSLLTVVLLILPLKKSHYLASILILTSLVVVTSARTFNLTPEDTTMKKAGEWYLQQLKLSKQEGSVTLFNEESRVACSHILFYHFTDKTTNDFIKYPIIDFTKEDTDSMEVGDLVVWDSHYGYRPELRPTSQTYDYYDKNPDFEKIQYYQSKDNRFLIAFFRKVKD